MEILLYYEKQKAAISRTSKYVLKILIYYQTTDSPSRTVGDAGCGIEPSNWN